MNTRKLFKLGSVLLVLILALSAMSFAQQTWYVNGQTGSDGYNGLSPTAASPAGPKLTIGSAITAASAGDLISIDFAGGNTYNEVVTVAKKLTFTSTNGTPTALSIVINNASASPNNTVTFTGPFKFNNGITLQAGAVIGAGNLTVGGTVTRYAISATASSTVDAQLLYTGTVNFVYQGGFAITTGLELAPSTDLTTIGAVTTSGAGTDLTLNESKTMGGVLTTSGLLKLGGFTLTINGANTTHALGGAVSNGTLAFSMTGAATVATGAFAVPTVTASGAYLLTLTQATATGAVTANSSSSITLTAATTTGNLTNNSSGTITATAATTVGVVTNAGSGTITLTAATTIASITNSSTGVVASTWAGAAVSVTGNVVNNGTLTASSTGQITFASTAGVTIGGNLTNTPVVNFPTSSTANLTVTNAGVVTFADGPHTITGTLTNSPTFGGTSASGAATTTTWTGNGAVTFATTATALTFTGGITVGPTFTLTNGSPAGASGNVTITGNGAITFASTSGNILGGGITISTSYASLAAPSGYTGALTQTGNGSILIASRTTGKIGNGTGVTATASFGPIVSTASGSNSTSNGTLSFGNGGGFYGTSLATSGGAGGAIIIGNENFVLSGGISNARTSSTLATGHIQVGSAATNSVNISIGGDVNNSGASSIIFNSYSGATTAAAENFTVAGGLINSGSGTISMPTAVYTDAGAFGAVVSFGSINITAGTINLAGAGASTKDIVVNGSSNFAGGTFNMGTSVARNLKLGALSNSFSTASGRTDFSSAGMANVTLLIQATSIFGQQVINGNGTITIWYGPMNVNNSNNNSIVPGVIFQGGNFRVLGNVTFAGSKVNLNGMFLFVGGQATYLGAGNFTNTSGYTTTGNAFVSLNGNANQTISGAGDFGNFEVDATGWTATIQNGTGKFTATFNLTAGTVSAQTATDPTPSIVFNNATTFPTIVRNAGTFAWIPTFTSKVNVYYIGIDKTSGKELPSSATSLNNLTVATTNGQVSGKGTVEISTGLTPTVNGVINVFPGQALLIRGTATLTMKGSSIQLDGDIVNDAGGANALYLGAAAGTTITGAGSLPDIIVKDGSLGNVINGSAGLATGLLGADYLRGGVADLNPGTGGSIVFAANTSPATSSLTVNFATANSTSGVHLSGAITTVSGGSLILGANLIHGGNLTNAAGGTVNVATFTYTTKGTTVSIDGTSTTTGTGSFVIQMNAATALTVTSSAATIAANVTVTTNPTTTAYTLSHGGFSATVNGNLTLAGTATVDVANGLTLTAAGAGLTLGTGTAVTAAGGTGILRLNAVTPPLTFTYSGTPTIANLTITNDVVLAGTGTSLTISGAFVHNGGNLNFAAVNLTSNGTYVRSGTASYTATTGYFIVGAAATGFNQGSTAVTIPNLRLANGGNLAAAGTGVVTVSGTLDVQVAATFTFTHTVSSAPKLTVADGATVSYGTTGAANGDLDVSPTYAGTIKFTSKVNGNISTVLWPATATLVTTFTADPGAGNTSTLTSARQVNTALVLKSGTLALVSRVLTLADNTTITVNDGVVTVTTGSIAYPSTNNVNVVYAANAVYTAGPELGATVKDLTITRGSNIANFVTNINKAVTVNGNLIIRNDLTTGVNGAISLKGGLTVATDASYALATAPVTTFGAALQFVGSTDQTITVPAGTTTLGAITINTTGGANVILTGGNLSSTFVTFTSGLFMTGSNSLVLAGNTANSATSGYSRVVAAGAKSHVVGNVRVPLKLGQIIPFGRNEFPVGDATYYRPAALTFVNTSLAAGIGLGVSATAKYDGTRPTGIVGLPIANGVSAGVDIARYPGFSWSISTTGSLGAQPFNLELTAEGYTDFDDVANVRLIRRNGALTDVTNQWLLQGAQYDNFVISGTPTVVNVNSVGGLIQGGAIYTYGLKSTMTLANPIANVNLTDAATTFTRNLTNPALFTGAQGAITYSVSIANPAVATVAIANNVLTVTRKVSGATSVTVTGTDGFDGSRISQTFQLSVVSDVEQPGVVPTEFTLSQNFPNPFNPSTTIRFALPKEAPVTLEIYNILGMKIRTLISNETMNAAFHTVVWDGKDDAGVGVPSGMYLYRIHADKFQASKKMTLLK